MVSTIHTALTGLNAASQRISNSANNIANQFSTSTVLNGQVVDKPFTPQQVQQTSLETGGVKTVRKDQDQPTFKAYNPSNPAADGDGLVEFPNVNLEREVVNLITAGYDFKANLRVIEAESNNQDKLLDILS